jgi:hypothetical protein
MHESSITHFTWQPGIGIDAVALARLRSHFARPEKPMGEAWFMGEKRRMFDELLGDIDGLSAWDLKQVLTEIASGTSSFGPLKEWHDWYHYLLGRLLPRAHESFVSSLLESLITGFMAIYPNGIHAPPYPQFHDDVLLTLGRCMMEPSCWDGDDIEIGAFLHRSDRNPNRIWGWSWASGDFSASMFFCLKYLPPARIGEWFASVLAIPSPHWRAQVIVWLVGAHPFLSGKLAWMSQLDSGVDPWIHWEWSHCLRPELATADDSGAAPVDSLLPKTTCDAVLAVARMQFSEDVYLDWLESIGNVPYLVAELAAIPTAFEALYVGRGRLH